MKVITLTYTAFVNYTVGPVSVGYQEAAYDAGGAGGTNEYSKRWGIAFNVNENLSISYGEAETEYAKAGAAHVTEDLDGIAISYTMGSMKIAGNRNEGSNIAGTTGVGWTRCNDRNCSFIRVLIQFKNYRKSPNLLGLFFVQNLN